MKRSEFLKKLGLGIVAIPVAGKIISELPAEEFQYPERTEKDFFHKRLAYGLHDGGVAIDVDELHRRYGNRSIQEVMEIWRETGDLIYMRGL